MYKLLKDLTTVILIQDLQILLLERSVTDMLSGMKQSKNLDIMENMTITQDMFMFI